MTKKITELQRQLLERAAGEPITDAAAVDASISSALIKRRLVILLPAEGDGGRLIVTAAGLAVLARASAGKAAKSAADAGATKPGPDAGRADARPGKGKSARGQPAHSDPPGPPPAAPQVALPKGKLGALAALLVRPEGASVEDMMAATGWQAHSVRGAMSGGLKKALGFVIESEKAAAGRVYRIVDGGTA
jgi:hypothetical protein